MKPIRILCRATIRRGFFLLYTLVITASSIRAEVPSFDEMKATAEATWQQARNDFDYWLENDREGQKIKPYVDQATVELYWCRDKVLLPGIAALDLIGLDPRSQGPTVFGYELINPRVWWAWLTAFLISWFMWFRVLRVSYCVVARRFGFYHPAQFLWLTQFWLPWRWPYQQFLRLWRWYRRMRSGAGANRQWAGLLEIFSHVFDQDADQVLVGRPAPYGVGLIQPVGIPRNERHVTIVAAPGAGKTNLAKVMIGANVAPDQSLFAIDVDGTLVGDLGNGLKAQGHPVFKYDPDGLDKRFGTSAHWNPLDELTRAAKRHGLSAVGAFADRLAAALIVPDGKERVFADTARVFCRSLLLWTWLVEKPKDLVRFRELLTQGLETGRPEGHDAFQWLLFEMSALPAKFADGLFDDGCNGDFCDSIAAGAGVMQKAGGTKEGKNHFLSTALYQTAWMDDANMRPLLVGESDVCGEDLKTTNACVFAVTTLSDIQEGRMGPFMRAWTMLSMYAFERMPDVKSRRPTMFLLDEVTQLRISTLATAIPGFRKLQIYMVVITQSIGLLKKAFPDDWREFIGEAAAVIWMGLNDPETLKVLCDDMLGQYLRKERISGTPWWHFWVKKANRIRPQYQRVSRPLLTIQQAAELLEPSTGNIIVTRFGLPPLRLKRLVPHVELPVWTLESNPNYGESFLRSLTRRLMPLVSAHVAPRLKAFEEFMTELLNRDDIINVQWRMVAVGLLAATFSGSGWKTWREGGSDAWVGLVVGIGTGAVAAVLGLAVLGGAVYAAWKASQALLAGKPIDRIYERDQILTGVTALIGATAFIGAGRVLAAFSVSQMPDAILLPGLGFAAAVLLTVCSWPFLLVSLMLVAPVLYGLAVGILTPVLLLTRRTQLEEKAILLGRWGVTYLAPDSRAATLLTRWLDRWTETLAKRSAAAPQPHDEA